MRIETTNLVNKVAYAIGADRIVYIGQLLYLNEIKVSAARLLLTGNAPAAVEGDVTIIAGPGLEPLEGERAADWVTHDGTYLCVIDGQHEFRPTLLQFLRLASLVRHRAVFVFTCSAPTHAIYTVGAHVEGQPWAGDVWKTILYLQRAFPTLEFVSTEALPFGATLVWSQAGAPITADDAKIDEALAAEIDARVWTPGLMADELKVMKAGENLLDILARLPSGGAPILAGKVTTVPSATLDRRRGSFSIELAPETVYSLERASLAAPPETPQKVLQYFSAFGRDEQVSVPSIRMNHVTGAVVYGRGVVGLGNDMFFSDSAAEFLWRGNYPEGVTLDVDAQRFHFDYPPVRSLSCNGAVLLMKTNSANNYGHWLVDALPKLALADPLLAEPDLTLLLPRLSSAAQEAVIESSIKLTTRRNVEFVRLEDREPVSVPELYYVSPVSWHPGKKHPAALSAMRARIHQSLRAEVSPRDIIYVSRRGVRTRRIVNEDAVASWVESIGGRVLAPESLSFEEQVRTFSRCRILIGPTGAALTNCVFMPEGSRVVALAPWGMPDPFFWDICGIVGIHYACLVCAPIDRSMNMNVDFAVDLEGLKEVVNRAAR